MVRCHSIGFMFPCTFQKLRARLKMQAKMLYGLLHVTRLKQVWFHSCWLTVYTEAWIFHTFFTLNISKCVACVVDCFFTHECVVVPGQILAFPFGLLVTKLYVQHNFIHKHVKCDCGFQYMFPLMTQSIILGRNTSVLLDVSLLNVS